MNRNAPAAGHNKAAWIVVSMMTVAIFAGAVWWFGPSTVKLSEDDYAITLALYRVCNQRSEEGLDAVEVALDETVSANAETPSRRAIEAIIAEARSQQWQAALIDCRAILDGQVNR
jgi:hypothetical protein